MVSLVVACPYWKKGLIRNRKRGTLLISNFSHNGQKNGPGCMSYKEVQLYQTLERRSCTCFKNWFKARKWKLSVPGTQEQWWLCYVCQEATHIEWRCFAVVFCHGKHLVVHEQITLPLYMVLGAFLLLSHSTHEISNFHFFLHCTTQNSGAATMALNHVDSATGKGVLCASS